MTVEALLEVRDLQKWFPLRGGLFGGPREVVKAVDGVSFDVRRGEVLSLVGESGSGKSTVGRSVLRLTPPTAGTIRFAGTDITGFSRRQMRPFRQRMQLVFQDPFASLNPRMTVESILAAPLEIHRRASSRSDRRHKVEEALRLVGLLPQHAGRYPHEF